MSIEDPFFRPNYTTFASEDDPSAAAAAAAFSGIDQQDYSSGPVNDDLCPCGCEEKIGVDANNRVLTPQQTIDALRAEIVRYEDKLSDTYAGIRRWKENKLTSTDYNIDDEMLVRYLERGEASAYLD